MVQHASIKVLQAHHKAYHRLSFFFSSSFCDVCQVLYQLSVSALRLVPEQTLVQNQFVPKFPRVFRPFYNLGYLLKSQYRAFQSELILPLCTETSSDNGQPKKGEVHLTMVLIRNTYHLIIYHLPSPVCGGVCFFVFF